MDEIIISEGIGQTEEEMIELMNRISEKVIPHFKDDLNTEVKKVS